MTIRRLRPGDGPLFRALRLESLAVEPDIFAADPQDYGDTSDADWEAALAARIVFAAFDAEGAAVGMASILPMGLSRMSHRALLLNVYLRAGNRGSGLARELLHALETEARNAGIVQIELGVMEDNERAIRFYEREGYRRFGLIPRGFRRAGMYFDEILMLRELDAAPGTLEMQAFGS